MHTENLRSGAAPPIVRNGIPNSHRRLSLQRCSTNCQGQVFGFTLKTFVPKLLQQLSKTGSPIHTEDFRSSAAPPTVQDTVLQFTPKTFAPTLRHQLLRTSSPIHTGNFRSNAAPPTVKDEFSNSHRKLSFQRWSTNCQRHVLQFIPETFAPTLHHQLSRTSSPIRTENFRSNAGPPTVKDTFSNSYRKLSFQRWSTNCQRHVLQFIPETFAPTLLHQLSKTSSPIHTENFRSNAAPRQVLQFDNDNDNDNHNDRFGKRSSHEVEPCPTDAKGEEVVT